MYRAVMDRTFRISMFGWLMAAVFLTAALGAQSAFSMARRPPKPAYVPGHVLVKFNDGVAMERIGEIVAGENARIERKLGRIGVYLVILPEGADVEEAVDRFTAFPEVQYAEPDRKVKFQEKK